MRRTSVRGPPRLYLMPVDILYAGLSSIVFTNDNIIILKKKKKMDFAHKIRGFFFLRVRDPWNFFEKYKTDRCFQWVEAPRAL